MVASGYVPGRYRWGQAMRLTGAVLTCTGPTAGTLTLQLEVGGALAGPEFTVTAGLGEVQRALALGVPVPAGSLVRWRVQFDGAVEEAAAGVAITLSAEATTVARQLEVWEVLAVGRQRRLYGYDAVAHQFLMGDDAGQFTIVQNGDTGLSVNYTPGSWGGTAGLKMEVAAGEVRAVRFMAGGGTITAVMPRLEFKADGRVIGRLTHEGELRVAELREEAPTATEAGFEFWSGGALTGTLTESGLTAGGLAIY